MEILSIARFFFKGRRKQKERSKEVGWETKKRKKGGRGGKVRGKVGYHLGSPRWEKIIRPREYGSAEVWEIRRKIISEREGRC